MAFRFDKLTLKAQEAVQQAQELAADAGNPQLEPLHLLAALVGEQEGVVRSLLERIGVNQSQLQQIVTAELSHLPKSSGGTPPQPSPDLTKVLESAQNEAGAMQNEFVSTEHLLLALAKTKTKAQDILKLNALTEQQILDAPARTSAAVLALRIKTRKINSRRWKNTAST